MRADRLWSEACCADCHGVNFRIITNVSRVGRQTFGEPEGLQKQRFRRIENEYPKD